MSEKSRHYWSASRDLRRELGQALPRDQLKALHRKDALRHFAVTLRLVLVVALCVLALTRIDSPWLWIPFSVLLGLSLIHISSPRD